RLPKVAHRARPIRPPRDSKRDIRGDPEVLEQQLDVPLKHGDIPSRSRDPSLRTRLLAPDEMPDPRPECVAAVQEQVEIHSNRQPLGQVLEETVRPDRLQALARGFVPDGPEAVRPIHSRTSHRRRHRGEITLVLDSEGHEALTTGHSGVASIVAW